MASDNLRQQADKIQQAMRILADVNEELQRHYGGMMKRELTEAYCELNNIRTAIVATGDKFP